MIAISIESTAHTFACAVISGKGKVFSDVREVYKTEKGGMIPSEVARHHENIKDLVVKKAIEKSGKRKFDLVIYSRGPGLPPSLHVGYKVAKELAEKFNIPLIGSNHCVSHLTHGKFLAKMKDPVYLYVSGANTQVIALEGNRFRIFGETLDVGLGNALDKFGRILNLGFPAGPKIEKLAKGNYLEIPYVVKGMDVSFSGIVTHLENRFNKGDKKEDLCFSFQETAFAMLTEVAERALAHTGKRELLLIGGVAANKRFCEMLKIMCEERGAKFGVVPFNYSADNPVMIGWQGMLEYKSGEYFDEVRPYERTDDVVVNW